MASKQQKRDIYYLVFDRYARADVLREAYNYDNSDFTKELRKRGFSVIDNSFANYQRTTHSLISSLNFDYLDRLSHHDSSESSDWVPLYRMLGDTRIVRFLRMQGYCIHHFGGWWEPTRFNKQANFSHNWFAIPEALRVLYENSLILSVARRIGIKALDPRYMQYKRSQLMFETLAKLGHEKPIFVFAHFLLPHPPFVTDETGGYVSIADASSRNRIDNYIGQLRYANMEILRLVDAIKTDRDPEPIIILQSDEGPWPYKYAGEEIAYLGRDISNVDWRTIGIKDLKEKLAIFAAIYLPDENISIPSNSSPVNNFRIILKNYFSVKIELLPNRHFVYESDRNLYKFIKVNSILNAKED